MRHSQLTTSVDSQIVNRDKDNVDMVVVYQNTTFSDNVEATVSFVPSSKHFKLPTVLSEV